MLVYVTILIILMLFQKGPRVTNVVLAGDLVPASTVLVTPALRFVWWPNGGLMKGLVDYQTRTVARKSSIGGFAFVRGDFTFEQGGLDTKI